MVLLSSNNTEASHFAILRLAAMQKSARQVTKANTRARHRLQPTYRIILCSGKQKGTSRPRKALGWRSRGPQGDPREPQDFHRNPPCMKIISWGVLRSTAVLAAMSIRMVARL